MSGLAFYAAVCSDVGNKRSNNEDNFSLLGSVLPESDYYGRHAERSDVAHEGVVAVFDGMGGVSNGEVASMEAAGMVGSFRDRLTTLEPEAVAEYAQAANVSICARIEEKNEQMGSTLTVVAIRDGRCTVGNIGDSRIYLLHGGELRCLSEDHTVSAQMVQMQMLTEEEAKNDKRRHQLTQHLGIPADVMAIQPHVVPDIELHAGDRLLLCSDGVTDVLSDSDLKTLLSQNTSCDKMAGGIVDSAMLAGSPDNVTALVVKIGWERPGAAKAAKAARAKNPDLETTLTVERPFSPASAGQKAGGNAIFNAVWAVSGVLCFILGAILSLLL